MSNYSLNMLYFNIFNIVGYFLLAYSLTVRAALFSSSQQSGLNIYLRKKLNYNTLITWNDGGYATNKSSPEKGIPTPGRWTVYLP